MLSKHHSHHGKAFAKFKAGELVRPADYREPIFVGSPVTPKDMNDGKPAFPEFHNVYIDPVSWAHYKKTGEFRSGTIIVKEPARSVPKNQRAEMVISRGISLASLPQSRIKSVSRTRPNNWAYFGFGDKASAAAEPDDACAACHKANAAQDMVFTQHYPVLRAAKSK